MTKPKGGWKGMAPALSAQQYERVKAVARQRAMIPTKAELRAMREAVPTNTQLSRELGVSRSAIGAAMTRGIKRYDVAVLHENGDGV